MTPEELNKRITAIENQLKQFQNVAELDPQIQRTILNVVGALNISLDTINDVVLSSPSNGQVLKFDGTNWVNGTDNT